MVTISRETPSNVDFTENVYAIRLVMIGESDVGKTSLVKKFVNPDFEVQSVKQTTGSDIYEKKFKMNGKNIHLMVFDTAGTEKYRALPRSYYRGAHAVMLVYDVKKRSSFEKLGVWMKDIDTNAREHVVKVVVGNKAHEADTKQVRHSEGREYAEGEKAAFVETSAIMGIAIESAFEEVVSGALKVKEFWDSPKTETAVVKLSGPPPKKTPVPQKGGCC